MTFRVHKSQLGDDAESFPDRVEAFRKAKLDHHATIGEPAPSEHHLVESCVRRVPRDGEPDDYVTDYEVIDDTPKKTLRERKNDLLHRIGHQELDLMVASMPHGKRRLDDLRAAELNAKPADQHTADDAAYLAARKARVEREHKIMRHAAVQMAAVEDLTEANIDSWQPEPFPE